MDKAINFIRMDNIYFDWRGGSGRGSDVFGLLWWKVGSRFG
jgi:hypothetical protein